MNKKDFIKECQVIAKDTNDYWESRNYYQKKEPEPSHQDRFLSKWTSGGISGGSCWSTKDTEYYSVKGDPEKELDGLDLFLSKHFPNISFIQYKRISKLIKHDSYTQYEYYGNSTEYSCKYLLFEDLYNVLVELGMI